MIIVGEQEEKTNTISVRRHGGENLGSITIEAFKKLIDADISNALSNFKLTIKKLSYSNT